MVITLKKPRGRKRTSKTPVISPKKKTSRLAGKRLALFSLLLIFLLVSAVFILFRVLHTGTEDISSVPSTSPPDTSRLSPDEIETRIVALNEEITGRLGDIGLGAGSLAKRTETARTERDIDYIEITEDYTVPATLRTDRVREYLTDYVNGFHGILKEESADSSGGFDMTIFAYTVPIRRLSFRSGGTMAPPTVPPGAPLPRVAIIVDDMGADMGVASKFLSLKYPVTLSVMPYLDRSTETAELAHKKGREVMLHLPMEPIDYPKYNPGVGALFTFMGRDEFVSTLKNDLAVVPYISGVNNHMGSRLTMDEEKMTIVLSMIKERNLFFVDSRTTAGSMAFALATNLGVPAIERNVFLDNDNNVESIKARIYELLDKAKANGKALAICHPRSETIKALKEMEGVLAGSTVEVVRVKDLLKK